MAEELADAKRQRDEAVELLKATEQVMHTLSANGADGVIEQALERQKRIEMLTLENDRIKQEAAKVKRKQDEKYESLMQQFEALQTTVGFLKTEEQERPQLVAEIARLEKLNTQLQDAVLTHKIRAHEAEEMQKNNGGSSGRSTDKTNHGSPELKLRVKALEDLSGQIQQSLNQAHELNAEKDEQIAQLESLLETFQMDQYSGEGRSSAELEGAMAENRIPQRRLDELGEEVQNTLTLRRQRDDRYVEMETKYNIKTEMADKLAAENDRLKAELVNSQEVSHQAIIKLRKDMEDRPFLVDKRLCVQMLTAYLHASSDTKPEILSRMSDTLGFTKDEREMLGIQKGVLSKRNSQSGKEAIGDQFLDFLLDSTS